MAEKKVTVTIDGRETVSTATRDASAGLDLFGKKIPFVLDAAKLLEMGMNLLRAAFASAKEFVVDSIRAYDDYASSSQRLNAQSKLTGVSVGTLRDAAKRAREEFGLGIGVSNDAAVTTAKYASRAGDATRQNELLAAALNLGAASGLNAAQSMEALEMGLRGQDEGFDKLLGKNPSSIWKEYADANGLAVGKMTDMQKRMAELTAVVEAGNKVGDQYNERLASGAGQQDLMNNKIENAKIAFGAALQPIRILIIQGLSALIDIATPVVVALAKVANFTGEFFVGSFHMARSAVGSLAEGIGKLTGLKSLEEWGRAQSQAFPNFIEQLKKMETQLGGSKDAATEHGKAHELAAVKITASADATKKATDITSKAADTYFDKASAKLGKPLADLIDLTTTSIDRLSETGRDQLDPKNAEAFARHMGVLRAEADKGNAAMANLGQNAGKANEKTAKIAFDTGGIARAALDAASSFGVIDDSARRSLESAVNIATALGKMIASGFSFAGVVGVIGGVASLVSSMMANDSERRRLLRENNVQLERLRTEMGSLSLTVSGTAFENAKDALGLALASRLPGQAIDEAAFAARLREGGSSIADIEKLAKELGITIRDDRGRLDYRFLQQLQTAIWGMPSRGFGTDFLSQRDSVMAGFGVNNTSQANQISGLASLGARFSPILEGIFDAADLQGTRTRLASVFTRLQSGGVSNRELGGLTGSQLLELITDLIARIDNLPTSAPVAPSGSTSTGDGGMPSSSGGAPTIPQESVQVVIKAMDTNLAGILTTHTDLHNRIAKATEGSHERLVSIDGKMSQLIVATSDGAATINVRLEALRLVAAANAGRGPSFG